MKMLVMPPRGILAIIYYKFKMLNIMSSLSLTAMGSVPALLREGGEADFEK